MTRTVLQAAAAALGSEPERALETQLRQAGIAFVREYPFHPTRRWRADFRIGDLLLEVDGGSWIGGRHTSGTGFEADCRKLSCAAVMGYRVLRVTPRMVESGEALALVEQAIGRGWA